MKYSIEGVLDNLLLLEDIHLSLSILDQAQLPIMENDVPICQ